MSKSNNSLADFADWLKEHPAEKAELARILGNVISGAIGRLSARDRERLKAILERFSGG